MPKYPGRPPTFTDEQIAAALKLYEEGGASLKEAAASIGITVGRLQVRRAKLRGKPYLSSSQPYRRGRQYRLMEFEYQQLLEKHDGKCAICGVESEQLVIDHDHVTGAVRGMLCGSCNLALGWLERWLKTSDKAWVERATGYLEKRVEPPLKHPPGRRQSFTEEQIRSAKALRDRGWSWDKAAASINISVTRLQARIRQLCPTN